VETYVGEWDSLVNQQGVRKGDESYFCNVRQFANGDVEAVLNLVRPMEQDARKRAWEGFSELFPKLGSKSEDASEADKDANHRRAVRRAKQTIRFKVKEMGLDRLFTLTYRENVIDREKVKADFTRFLRLARKYIEGWSYIAVLEKQERGAYHIHCAVRGWQKIKVLRACWHEALGIKGSIKAILDPIAPKVLATGDSAPGNVDVTRPEKGGRRNWQAKRLAAYLVKYLGKTFDESTEEKRRYWQSKDCSEPIPVRCWVEGTGPLEALRNCVALLRERFGLDVGASFWSAPDCSAFWICGRLAEGRMIGVPF
jgi:hypothetical protein